MRNHAPDVAAMDLFVVPNIGFDLLYAFVIVRLDRRDLAWVSVITNPTAEWVVRQITEAFPWDGAPGYMIRDRDRIYGTVVTRRLRVLAAAMNNAFFGDGQAKGNLGEMPSVGRRDTVPRRHSGEPEKCGQPAL